MSSLTPFISKRTRGLAPSNFQLLVERLDALPDDQFLDMARRVQWDEIITAPQSMEIDDEMRVVNKQILSPLQYAIWVLPADRLQWLLPHAREHARREDRHFRNEELLIHSNDMVSALLATAVATGDRKKVDAVLDNVTPDDHHCLMRMPVDIAAGRATELLTPEENLEKIPAAVAHLATRVHKDILMRDSMFQDRPRDAKRLAEGIRKNFMTAFASRGRIKVLETAYPEGRKVPLKVWQSALSHGGLVDWCAKKIDFISTPSDADRRSTDDWSMSAEPCHLALVIHASYQSQSVDKEDFITPDQRAQQHEWTLRAIEIMGNKCMKQGIPENSRFNLWETIPRLCPQLQDALAQCLNRIQAAHAEGFAEDWGLPSGEIASWIKHGRADLAAARADAFPGVMPADHALELSSRLCLNWCASRSGMSHSRGDWPLVSLDDQVLLHEAWGLQPAARELLDSRSQEKIAPEVLAEIEAFMLERVLERMERNTTPTHLPSVPRRI